MALVGPSGGGRSTVAKLISFVSHKIFDYTSTLIHVIATMRTIMITISYLNRPSTMRTSAENNYKNYSSNKYE